jgi:heme/copper-type cytochrome/quinol oxidase subunit 4
MKLIKCLDSFLIGFYLAFILTLLITGYTIVEGFVSKDMLSRSSFYMDGKTYKIQRN